MRLHFLISAPMLLVSLMLSPAPAAAQESTCPAILDRALSSLGTNCAGLNRNNACYGYSDVEATFNQTVPADFFSMPSDRAELRVLDTLQTAPLNEETGEWGIATLNVQANLPGALPGQSVVYLLLGAVELQNAVPPEDALTLPATPLEVTAAQAMQLRSRPDARAGVASTIQAATPLLADGVSPDGQWVRVFFMAGRQATAWASVDDLEAADLSALPVIGPQSRTPMQAFQLRTGVGGVACEDAPSFLLIQGPDNIEVDINANGADIRIGSLIVLFTLSDGTLQIIVISGGATLNPKSSNPIYLPPGFTSLCSGASTLTGNCDWSAPRIITVGEEQMLQIINRIFVRAPNLFHYVVLVPDLVCASGVGGVVCELIFANPDLALARAREQCSSGLLSADVCRILFPAETS
jgi:hypothetical protein